MNRVGQSSSNAAVSQGGSASIKVFNFEKNSRKAKKIRKRKPENLIRRAGGLKQRKDLKYSNFQPLYELWCGYFTALIDQMKSGPDERLLKADYHGCLLRVEDAPNPSQIGLHGIVIHESKSTFQMVTRKDKLIVISKEKATFQFVLGGKVFTLIGDALRQKSFLRGKKQKSQMTLPFFLK
uniref:Ribonuclease P protein subunit p29 n=1 Tax=Ditylenchus dipsaci TaxID=166011 RepID=A0A915D855_9BILA